jgi:hypothetical protein
VQVESRPLQLTVQDEAQVSNVTGMGDWAQLVGGEPAGLFVGLMRQESPSGGEGDAAKLMPAKAAVAMMRLVKVRMVTILQAVVSAMKYRMVKDVKEQMYLVYLIVGF